MVQKTEIENVWIKNFDYYKNQKYFIVRKKSFLWWNDSVEAPHKWLTDLRFGWVSFFVLIVIDFRFFEKIKSWLIKFEKRHFHRFYKKNSCGKSLVSLFSLID